MAKDGYSNELRGVLFKSDRKEKPSDRDYRGNCEVAGVQYWISGWINESRAGVKYLGLQFAPKGEQPAGGGAPRSEEDDDVGF